MDARRRSVSGCGASGVSSFGVKAWDMRALASCDKSCFESEEVSLVLAPWCTHASAVRPRSSEALPDSLHVYHDLVALEPGAGALPHALVNVRFPAKHGLTGAAGDPSRVFGYRTHTYKATCALDGKCYVLRRVENFPLQLPMAISAAERWRKIRHPSIVAVREAFTTRAFGDPCACD